MVSPQLLSKLQCMHTGRPLKHASRELLARVNAAITANRLHDIGGRQIEATMHAALINEAETILYPIVRDVVQLMRDEVIDITPFQEHEKDA